MEPLGVIGGAFVPEAPGGPDRSRGFANSGKGKFSTLERTVFFGNVHLVLGSMLTEARLPMKLKGKRLYRTKGEVERKRIESWERARS